MTSFVAQLKDLIFDICEENPRYGVKEHAWIYCEATVDVVGVICLDKWVSHVKRIEKFTDNECDGEWWVKVTFKEVGVDEMVCGCRRIVTDISFVTVVPVV